MKLHDALRKIFKLFGISVLQEKRLVFLLADYKAFDDFPAMKQVMEAIVTGRYGRELCLRSADDDSGDYELYTEYLRKSLVGVQRFRKEFARYAADSISFALGLCDSVNEPQDHDFDPYRRDSDDADDVSGDAEVEKAEKEKEPEVVGDSEVKPVAELEASAAEPDDIFWDMEKLRAVWVEPEASAAEPDDTKPAPSKHKDTEDGSAVHSLPGSTPAVKKGTGMKWAGTFIGAMAVPVLINLIYFTGAFGIAAAIALVALVCWIIRQTQCN